MCVDGRRPLCAPSTEKRRKENTIDLEVLGDAENQVGRVELELAVLPNRDPAVVARNALLNQGVEVSLLMSIKTKQTYMYIYVCKPRSSGTSAARDTIDVASTTPPPPGPSCATLPAAA